MVGGERVLMKKKVGEGFVSSFKTKEEKDGGGDHRPRTGEGRGGERFLLSF